MGTSIFHLIMTASMFRAAFNVRNETEGKIVYADTDQQAQEYGDLYSRERWPPTDGWESWLVHVREFNQREIANLRDFLATYDEEERIENGEDTQQSSYLM